MTTKLNEVGSSLTSDEPADRDEDLAGGDSKENDGDSKEDVNDCDDADQADNDDAELDPELAELGPNADLGRRGKVGDDGKSDNASSAAPIVKQVLRLAGTAMCDMAFLFSIRQDSSLHALCRTTCLVLSVDAYKAVALQFPDACAMMKDKAITRAAQTVTSGRGPGELRAPPVPESILDRAQHATFVALVFACRAWSTPTVVVNLVGRRL